MHSSLMLGTANEIMGMGVGIRGSLQELWVLMVCGGGTVTQAYLMQSDVREPTKNLLRTTKNTPPGYNVSQLMPGDNRNENRDETNGGHRLIMRYSRGDCVTQAYLTQKVGMGLTPTEQLSFPPALSFPATTTIIRGGYWVHIS